MAGPADDLRSKVKDLGMSDPMVQIGTALGRAGSVIQDTYRKARSAVEPYLPTRKRSVTSGRSLTSRR